MNSITMTTFVALIACILYISNGVSSQSSPSSGTDNQTSDGVSSQTSPIPSNNITNSPSTTAASVPTSNQPTCDVNEQFSPCKSCEPSCSTVYIGTCPVPCTPGCACRPGLFRNTQGRCVTIVGCFLN
ncbi:uncharacterized protein LOC143145823 [Ptiloglossa arizonensis]|uniref:uncharacterized protein LOC143145823 n=1 Tax=Ptiloglossa arizonensis TaxID=3350558 RepID=UPI003F9FD91B